MRIQHAAQTASGLPADNPGRMQAKSVIVDEVERLRWRIWNGKAMNARRSIDRVRKVMHVYKDERGQHTRSAPSRRLWHALLDVDRYLISTAFAPDVLHALLIPSWPGLTRPSPCEWLLTGIASFAKPKLAEVAGSNPASTRSESQSFRRLVLHMQKRSHSGSHALTDHSSQY
jgi:hypothetical protein